MAARRSQPVRMAWMFTALLVCVALIAAIDLVFVHTVRGQWVDDAALAGTRIGRAHIIHPVSTILDVVSVGALALATITVGVVGFVRRRPVLALLAMLLVAGSVLTTEVFKHVVLQRPILDVADRLPFNTLPSGHTTVALSVGVAITLVVPARARPVAAVLGVVYGAATAVATMSAGWHRPSDAVAACLVVGAWTSLVGLVAVTRDTTVDEPAEDPVNRVLVTGLATLAALGLALGIAALAVTAFTIPQPSTRPRLFLAYAGGASAVAGTALAVMAWLLVVTRVGRTDRLDG